jgi:hypothetical protein
VNISWPYRTGREPAWLESDEVDAGHGRCSSALVAAADRLEHESDRTAYVGPRG